MGLIYKHLIDGE